MLTWHGEMGDRQGQTPRVRPSHCTTIRKVKFDDSLLHLHEADEAAVDWLTTYGS